MSVNHDNVPNLAAVGKEVMPQLVGTLIDLRIREDTLWISWSSTLNNTRSMGIILGVGGKNLMYSSRYRSAMDNDTAHIGTHLHDNCTNPELAVDRAVNIQV